MCCLRTTALGEYVARTRQSCHQGMLGISEAVPRAALLTRRWSGVVPKCLRRSRCSRRGIIFKVSHARMRRPDSMVASADPILWQTTRVCVRRRDGAGKVGRGAVNRLGLDSVRGRMTEVCRCSGSTFGRPPPLRTISPQIESVRINLMTA